MHMKNYSNKIRVLWVYYDIADYQMWFRKKTSSRCDISIFGERFKEEFRKKYSTFLGSVMHTGDNFRHNRQINKLLEELK